MSGPDGDVPITPEQFAEETKRVLDRFVAHWRERQRDNPADWPELLTEAEWGEQFLTWIGVHEL